MDSDKSNMTFETLVATMKKAWKAALNIDVEIEKEVFTDDFVACISMHDVFIEVDLSGDRVVYHPGYITHQPGVYRYADGSGEPPSEDAEYLIEEGTPILSIAINKIISHHVAAVLDDFWGSEIEKKLGE